MKNLYLALGILTIVSCIKEKKIEPLPKAPIAKFSYSIDYKSPSIVKFLNNSTDGSTFFWDFGDLETSSEINPTHKYKSVGAYTVKLKVIGNGGKDSVNYLVNIAKGVKISKVTISTIGWLDVAQEWDADSGPDVLIKVRDSNNTSAYYGDVIYEGDTIMNVTPSMLPLIWSIPVPFYIPYDRNFYILLYDDDTPYPARVMEYLLFNISKNTDINDPYPSSITKTRLNTNVKIELIWE
jgi:hypothetical protein